MTPVNATPPADWRETAWNGVRLRVPPGWEPREVGRRYLLLASPDGMERNACKVLVRLNQQV